MRKMLAIGMLGIFLLAVAAVQPVTASHQKSFVNKIPSSKELAEKKELAKKILKDPKILKEMNIPPILEFLLELLVTVAIILGGPFAWLIVVLIMYQIFPPPYV